MTKKTLMKLLDLCANRGGKMKFSSI